MIARFFISLPFCFSRKDSDTLNAINLLLDGTRVVVHPPMQSRLPSDPVLPGEPEPLWRSIELLKPQVPPVMMQGVEIDGTPAFPANLLVVDFLKHHFERPAQAVTKPGDLQLGDPPASHAFFVANMIIERFRHVRQASNVALLDINAVPWHMVYLTDSGEELPHEPDKYRHKISGRMHFRHNALTSAVWDAMWDLPPGYVPHIWDRLLLDARGLLGHEPGAALLIANAAVESFSVWSTDELARRSSVDGRLWSWINQRGDWHKEPSVAERLDVLLQVLTGKSLKLEPELWEAFRNLRAVRNAFSHEGRLIIGKAGEQITPEAAGRLVARAREIIEWGEALMPPELQRPRRLDVPVKWTGALAFNRPESVGQVDERTVEDSQGNQDSHGA